jgi:pimeloyl-ACP methyl ester carboxylesterase
MNCDDAVTPIVTLIAGVLTIGLSCQGFRSLSHRFARDRLRAPWRIFLSLIILFASAVTAITAINTISIWSFHPRDPVPGSLLLVNGHTMHIDCTGSGSPTIILESGLGAAWEIWSRVQPELSRTTRVCSYDRAGYGYSDVLASPRDADHIAAELCVLLGEAKVAGPIVLMGHSLGGVFIRDYATRYPDQVAGLIFVDAVTPSWVLGRVEAPPQPVTGLGIRMACATNFRGLVGACTWPRPSLDLPRWKLAAEGLCHPRICALEAEFDSFDQSGAETLRTGPYGNLPVLVISHDPTHAIVPSDWENAWDQMQRELTGLSVRSRRVVARGSIHVLPLDRPDLINKEVPLFIAQIRATTRQSAYWSARVIE